MTRRYFGTDGVRGPYGGPVINEGFAARLGLAAGKWLANGPGRILIGRDTRESGKALSAALADGFAAAGWEIQFLGVLPTPAVSRAAKQSGAAMAAMITASHNPAADNGIKFFGGDGRKLTEGDEMAIESLLSRRSEAAAAKGRAPLENGAPLAEYVSMVGRLLAPGSLKGWRIALDTANGATCFSSPEVLRGLGAELIGLGDAPDGANINAGVGSENPGAVAARVKSAGARLGIAHDGDGDRCLLCDETGSVLDGDEILTLLALQALSQGRLVNKTLVVTVHSNLGVDAAIAAAGGRIVRAAVGDRYVAEEMARQGATLGGESSGHVIFSEICGTGDGLVAALKTIEVMLATGRRLSDLRRTLKKFPQASTKVPMPDKRPLTDLKALSGAMAEIERELGNRGRVLVRYSGTEPVLRLLVEGPEKGQVDAGLDRLVGAVKLDLR